MNSRRLLGALRGAGVILTPERDGLHVDAPAGALTETLRSSPKFESFLCALRHLLLWSTYLFLSQAYAAFVA
jgi:hypothetical protein